MENSVMLQEKLKLEVFIYLFLSHFHLKDRSKRIKIIIKEK